MANNNLVINLSTWSIMTITITIIVILSVPLSIISSSFAAVAGAPSIVNVITSPTSSNYDDYNNIVAKANTTSKLKVVVSFYPIFEFVKMIGGDRVQASSLIPVGVEPHDYEPTVQQIQNAQSANMLIYNGAGFEGSWINKIKTKYLVDTSQGLNFGNNSDADIKDARGGINPHIWLDPILAKYQVEKIRDALIKVDPKNTAYYNENANKLFTNLDSLDASIKSAFSSCKKKDFIAFHNAFIYFAKRYGLNQHSIQGTSPTGGVEVTAQRLQEVIQLAHRLGINTIYSEELLDNRSANVIAQEIPNGKVLVLSPIEGVNKQEEKESIGYFDKMNQNIANLKVGLECNNNTKS